MFKKIKRNMLSQEKKYSKKACKNKDAILFENEEINDEIRPIFFRDIDKILNSSAYTRYIDKTQVYSFEKNDNITYRVLHVQLVSKIARTIARGLKLNEDLVEAISLGHDVGHAPFGHFGERCLNEICIREKIGYFKHNEQSIRVLRNLDKENISLQTLDGILAHNGEMILNKCEIDRNKTKEQFLQEIKNVETINDFSKKIKPMTLEGAVVRISDVISFIGRDIEDAIVLNIIKREDLPEEITNVLGNNNSKIVDTIVKDVIYNSYKKDYLCFSKDVYEAIKKLQKWNFDNIYYSNQACKNQEKVKKAIFALYDKYMQMINEIDISNIKNLEFSNEISKSNKIFYNFIKKRTSEYMSTTNLKRIVVDYIAGQTDRFFKHEVKERIDEFIKW